MTGTDQMVEEIYLERAIIIIRQVLDRKFAILLFTGQTTRILYETLDKFTADMPSLLKGLEPSESLSNEGEARALVLKYFAAGSP